jgi:type VI secretion system protein ImpH
VTYREELQSDPWGTDFLAALRHLERSVDDKPRIGDSAVSAEDIVSLGQDPFLEFPASNVTEFKDGAGEIPKLYSRFLGFFGPQGALPLNTTVDAYHWSMGRDPSFARFTDVFANRFLQLFFRAWANAQPIAHHDRPDDDRFADYVGSFAGIGVASLKGRDSLDDIAKLPFAGLADAQVKSAARLRQLLRGIFHVEVDVEERVGTWLKFEPSDQLLLGSDAQLGLGTYVGERVYSINDKICVLIVASDLEQYRKFLPRGELFDQLTDLIFFYLGHRFEFDVRLSLPARYAPPTRLGQSGELGWTAWVTPNNDAGLDVYFDDAHFNALERRRAQREAKRAGKVRKSAQGRSS